MLILQIAGMKLYHEYETVDEALGMVGEWLVSEFVDHGIDLVTGAGDF